MSLFLSQIEPEIKRELYRRINLSSHGFQDSTIKILEPIRMDADRHWYSRRKPWIRFTSGGLVKDNAANKDDPMYSEKSAIENVLFGGILGTAIDESRKIETNKKTGETITISNFKSTGLRGGYKGIKNFDGFSDVYGGKRNSPMAGITGITVKNKGDLGSIREAEITWTCWDEDHFNTLQRLFMTPGISCLLEWGWSIDSTGEPVDMKSTFFDLKESETKALGDVKNPYSHGNIKEQVIKNNGCYDACIGMINNFDWTFNTESGAYDCTTKLTAPGDSLLGMELGGSDPEKQINISGARRMDEWFTPKTFQAYVAGAGLRLEVKGLDVKGINLETDVQKLQTITGTTTDDDSELSWVGNILNCTKPGWNSISNAESSTLSRQERILELEQTGGKSKEYKFKAGSRIRVMEYPEISRYNGWYVASAKKASDAENLLADAMVNNPQMTGAFFFDQWPGFGEGNKSFITWAFFEEILINQFFAPLISKDNKTKDPADIMLLRSCNIIERDESTRFDHYKQVAFHNKWTRADTDLQSIFYESVRIGFNENLRSVDGGVLWIPSYPPPPGDSDVTKELRDSYDEFQCSKHGGANTTNSTHVGKDNQEGYLRNLMINTDAVKEAF